MTEQEYEMKKREYDQINEQRERECYKNIVIAEEAKFGLDRVIACANSIRKNHGKLLDMMDSKTEKNDLACALDELLFTIEHCDRNLKDDARWEALADAWIEKFYRPYIMKEGDAV
jgi:hypothetical protein